MVETVRRCVCDKCMKPGPDALESEDPIELAQNEGWYTSPIHTKDDWSTICPKCSKKE
jgi:hypothetical protein